MCKIDRLHAQKGALFISSSERNKEMVAIRKPEILLVMSNLFF
jgi:hypothetical protein